MSPNAKNKKPELKKYRVAIAYKCVKYFEVLALTKEHAIYQAEGMSSDGLKPKDYWESPEAVDEVTEVK